MGNWNLGKYRTLVTLGIERAHVGNWNLGKYRTLVALGTERGHVRNWNLGKYRTLVALGTERGHVRKWNLGKYRTLVTLGIERAHVGNWNLGKYRTLFTLETCPRENSLFQTFSISEMCPVHFFCSGKSTYTSCLLAMTSSTIPTLWCDTLPHLYLGVVTLAFTRTLCYELLVTMVTVLGVTCYHGNCVRSYLLPR